MTVPLTGPAGLFPRLATIGEILDLLDTWNGTTIPAAIQTMLDQYPDDEPLIDGIAPVVVSFQGGAQSLLGFLRTIAANTVIEMVADDINLPNRQLSTAIGQIIVQMLAASQTVQRSTVTSTVTAGASNTTDARVVMSLKTRAGLPLEDAYAEPIQVTVTSDSLTGGATAGQESLSVRGGLAESSGLSYQWPMGSGGTLSTTAIDAGSDGSNGLVNGGFETWTVANTPDSWTINVGTPGTNILQTTTHQYVGTSALQIVGSAVQVTLSQVPASLPALSQFAVNFWMGLSGSPAAGVLRIALVDGTGAVINDQTGTPNSRSITLSTAPTVYTPYEVVFRTPLLIPTGATVQAKLTTALSIGTSLYLDQVGFKEMEQLYQGGPYVRIFSGANVLTSLDTFTATIANNYGGSGSYQTLFQRLFAMNSLGYLLPSSGTPSIPNY